MIEGDEDSQIIAALVEQRDMSPSLAAALVAKVRESHTKVAANREEIMVSIFSRVINRERDRKIIAALVEKWGMPPVLAAGFVMMARKEYAKVAPVRRKISRFIFVRRYEWDSYPEIAAALVEQWDIHPAMAVAWVTAAREVDRKWDAAIAARAPGVKWIVGGCLLIVLALILTGVSYLAAAFLDIHWLIFTGAFIAGLLALLRGIFVLLFGEARL